MTHPDLTDAMRQATQTLAPEDPDHLISTAIRRGAQRRSRRRLLTGIGTAAVVGAAATGVLQLGPQADGPAPAADPQHAQTPTPPASPPASAAPTATPSYASGSLSEVPGGPQIPTQRGLASDRALARATSELLAGEPAQLTVSAVQGSGNGGHEADTSTDGRRVDFKLDGMAASVAVGRWDGYHAVGASLDGEQLVATDGKSACERAFQLHPALQCVQTTEGWYSVGLPAAGPAQPDAKELWVSLYTDDGWVVHVQSMNTVAEKQGSAVRAQPALSQAESLKLARSARWFRTSA